jgi:hypothetical protein
MALTRPEASWVIASWMLGRMMPTMAGLPWSSHCDLENSGRRLVAWIDPFVTTTSLPQRLSTAYPSGLPLATAMDEPSFK